jgi:hypothetical protein
MADVFISYSRKDADFVRRLHQALTEQGRDIWIDWEDIPLTADWWQEICAGIEAADNFLFIISPDSVRSAAAQAAEATAVLLGKRSLSLSLAAQSQLELSGSQQELPVILGVEALANFPPTWQAERALGLAVLNSHLQQLFDGHTDMVFNATFSPDGTRALTASADFTARLWDTRTGVELARYESPDSPIFNARYSPDGRRIAAAPAQEIVILDANLGETLLTISDDTLIGLALAWSPDGSKIAASVTSQEIGDRAAVWDAYSGDLLAVTGALDDLVINLDWSPDGQRLVTASADSTARIWDVRTGNELVSITSPDIGFLSADWSPGGDALLLVSGGGIVQEWFAWQQPDALVAFARDCCLIRALTPDERLRFGLAAQ